MEIAPYQELKNNLTSRSKSYKAGVSQQAVSKDKAVNMLPIRRGKTSRERWELSGFLNNGQQVQLWEKKTGHVVLLFYDVSSSARIKSLFSSEQMSEWMSEDTRERACQEWSEEWKMILLSREQISIAKSMIYQVSL